MRVAHAVAMLSILCPGALAVGRAVVCLDREFDLGKTPSVIVPAGSLFKNHGPITGDIAGRWHVGDAQKSRNAAFITTGEVKLSKTARCAEASVRMYVDNILNREAEAKAADSDYWAMSDVTQYKIGTRPTIEYGRLVDDVAVLAQLRSDAGDALNIPLPGSDRDAICIARAVALAGKIGGTAGRKTSVVVFINHPAAQGSSLSCLPEPSYTVAWSGSARPPAATLSLIGRAGAVLTGATEADIRALVGRCVSDAVKPAMMETAEREVDGVRAECQAFARDGGGGVVTVFRRFGPLPEPFGPR